MNSVWIVFWSQSVIPKAFREWRNKNIDKGSYQKYEKPQKMFYKTSYFEKKEDNFWGNRLSNV